MTAGAIQIITTSISAMAAVVAAIVGVRSHAKIDQVKIEINGRMSELLELTRQASHAEGMRDEKESTKDQ
jgi:hypothetical protein